MFKDKYKDKELCMQLSRLCNLKIPFLYLT